MSLNKLFQEFLKKQLGLDTPEGVEQFRQLRNAMEEIYRSKEMLIAKNKKLEAVALKLIKALEFYARDYVEGDPLGYGSVAYKTLIECREMLKQANPNQQSQEEGER